MNSFYQNLLGRLTNKLEQTQKEAMVDLCLLGMYADNSVSLAEQEFIDEEATTLKWESGISFNGYFQRAIAKVRDAKEDPEATKALLQSIGDRLGSEESKRVAVNELEQLLESDEMVKVEERFLSDVKTAMGIETV
ncbi:MAG: hypothetical protein ACFB4J_01315 [Elainellaceae cyanobacterium]